MSERFVVIAVFLVLIAAAWLVLRAPKRLPFPGPPRKPLLGNFLEIAASSKVHQMYKFSAKATKEYGSVVGIELLFGEQVIICADGEILKEVLKNCVGDGFINRSERFTDAMSLITKGLITLESDRWRAHRRLLIPTFNTRRLRAIVDISLDATDRYINEWRDKFESSSVEKIQINAHSVTNTIALDVLMEAVFSLNPVDHHDEFAKIAHAIHFLSGAVATRISVPKKIWKLLMSDTAEVSEQRDFYHDFVMKMIRQRMDEAEKSEEKDIVSLLVNEVLKNHDQAGSKFSEEDIFEEASMFFAAGHETTGNTICNLLYYVSNRPDVQKKMREEAIAADIEIRGYDALDDLPYIGACINETLRVHATAPISSRRLAQNMDIKGVDVPAGTLIFINFYSCNRNKEYWGQDAEEFRPERWLEKPDWSPKPGSFYGFGAGPQGCIGERMSRLEMKSVLARIMPLFEFSPAFDWNDPSQHPRSVHSITLGFKEGLPLYVTPIQS
eukprot:Clim_evm1s248 gene=Clim_evmTU1s248